MTDKKVTLPPLEVSPLIKRRKYAALEKIWREQEERDRPAREAYLACEKRRINDAQMAELRRIFLGTDSSDNDTFREVPETDSSDNNTFHEVPETDSSDNDTFLEVFGTQMAELRRIFLGTDTSENDTFHEMPGPDSSDNNTFHEVPEADSSDNKTFHEVPETDSSDNDTFLE